MSNSCLLFSFVTHVKDINMDTGSQCRVMLDVDLTLCRVSWFFLVVIVLWQCGSQLVLRNKVKSYICKIKKKLLK